MSHSLLVVHSWFRWLVLITLIFSVLVAFRGLRHHKPFTKTANQLRHWTATAAHIQLVIGIIVYIKSPVILYFIQHFSEAIQYPEMLFFGLIHSLLMFTSVIFVTIGSSLTKRKSTDQAKYKTMLIWFSMTLLLIFIAIPWPFSPLANRPYIRPF
jgi:hypothetical protein